jgi:hypothetical protein
MYTYKHSRHGIKHGLVRDHDLPLPRLELQWVKFHGHEDPDLDKKWKRLNSVCFYDLVVPLRELDIRAEDEDGNIGVHRTMRLPIAETLSTGEVDINRGTPFRDGAHSTWDRVALLPHIEGSLPVFLVAGDQWREVKKF